VRELPVIACSLDAGGQATRAGEFHDLFAGALLDKTRTSDGALLRFDPAHAAAVRELLAREKECCPFWDFRFSDEPGALRVEVHAPADAGELLDRLLEL